MTNGSLEPRRLGPADMDEAASVMRASYDERLPWLAGRHTREEDRAFFREWLLPSYDIWGAFDGATMIGILVFREGWIDQLYVQPGYQGQGVGEALLGVAKAASAELSLRTFQQNTAARRFYERHGFVAVEETDGSGNEEREPDVLYRWTSWRSLERFSFGDSPELADKLLALVLAGRKTATCWAARDGTLTEIGKRMVACDGQDRPRAVLETIELRCIAFSDVDEAFAVDEGEGDLSLAWWRQAHRRYFKRNGGFTPDMPLWCERFRLVERIETAVEAKGPARA